MIHHNRKKKRAACAQIQLSRAAAKSAEILSGQLSGVKHVGLDEMKRKLISQTCDFYRLKGKRPGRTAFQIQVPFPQSIMSNLRVRCGG